MDSSYRFILTGEGSLEERICLGCRENMPLCGTFCCNLDLRQSCKEMGNISFPFCKMGDGKVTFLVLVTYIAKETILRKCLEISQV